MKLEIKRIKESEQATLSALYIDGQFCCYGLEDKVRSLKIKGRTAIPAGRYRLGFKWDCGMQEEYLRKFPHLHLGMLEICEIPNYSHVYIHIGNYHSDTNGCILVGDYFKLHDGDYAVFNSKPAYQRLYAVLAEEMEKGALWVHIFSI